MPSEETMLTGAVASPEETVPEGPADEDHAAASDETVVRLRPVERLRQDAEPIATLYRNLGTTTAETVVTRALGELARTMAGLAAHIRTGEMAEAARGLRRLQLLAANLGMISLGQVAEHGRDCLDQGDSTAFAAVWARLRRVAEQSLAPDRDLLDRSLN